MDERSYPFFVDPNGSLYAFESRSPNKRIQKIVLITPTYHWEIFNLALLDVLDSGQLSDTVESNNGDLNEVLATVFRIMEHFLEHNPESVIMFKGSDARRHRLYRMVLGRQLSSLSHQYRVFGGSPTLMSPLVVNKDYEYYFIRRPAYERDENI